MIHGVSLDQLPLADIAAHLELNPPSLPYKSLIGVPSTSPVGYVEANANVVIPNVVTLVLNLGPINIVDAGDYLVEFWCCGYVTDQTAQQAFLFLEVDGSGAQSFVPLTNNTLPFAPIYLRRRVTLAAGNHSFSLHALTSGGTMTMLAGDGLGAHNSPMSIRVSRD